MLKSSLEGTQGNIPTVLEKLYRLLRSQNIEIRAKISRDKVSRYPQHSHEVFQLVQGKISSFALNEVRKQCEAVRLTNLQPAALQD